MTSNEPSPGNAAADPRSVGDWSRRLRRLGFFGIVGLSTVLAVWTMFRILAPNGLTAVEAAIIALFAVNFGWITISFWTAAAGFVLRLAGLDPITLARRRRIAGRPAGPIRTRTAIVMPICHEDVARVLAGLEATYRSVAATGELRHFDFYVLSDSSDPATARQEEAGWAALVGRLDADGRIFYRRRERRTGRKAGNVADFCCPALNLILELDGGVHVLRTDSDAARDAWLTARAGFTVLRFDNEAVLNNPAVVLEAVRKHAADAR